jgi:hypothetical protein
MESGEPGIIYSLVLSLLYRPVLKLLNGKLSSLRGFLIVYIIAVYTPISIYIARISTYIGLLFLIVGGVFLGIISVSGEHALKKSIVLHLNILDLSMTAATVTSVLLLLRVYLIPLDPLITILFLHLKA